MVGRSKRVDNKKLNVLIFGKDGQLGFELVNVFKDFANVTALGREQCNLIEPEDVISAIREASPDIIINAAAYTAVDRAEEESEQAYLINWQAVQVMALEAKRLGAWPIHYSTDYVYDGDKQGRHKESDIAKPINTYAKTKHAGERAIMQTMSKYIILRISWVYGVHGQNFVKTMLQLFKEKESLSVVEDQIGAPSSSYMIANSTKEIVQTISKENNPAVFNGIYNLCAQGTTSWYDFASLILFEAKKNGYKFKITPNDLYPISTQEYKSAAKRPLNSRLSLNKVITTFNLDLPVWSEEVKVVIKEILKN